jgi:hypothetical protein
VPQELLRLVVPMLAVAMVVTVQHFHKPLMVAVEAVLTTRLVDLVVQVVVQEKEMLHELAEQQVHQGKVTLVEMLLETPTTAQVVAEVQVLLVQLVVLAVQFLAVTAGLELTGNL